MNDAERQRLADDAEAWRRWGPYVSERAWGTVREDYSPDGDAWSSFPHDHARSRAYRWSEEGLGGICDDRQTLCLAFAFWNGRDPILKERIFGLTGEEGNHGEDAGPVWFPVNHLVLGALQRFQRGLGDGFTIEFPRGSGRQRTLEQVRLGLAARLVGIFLPDASAGGRRPVFGGLSRFEDDPAWHDALLFHEYFHGDNGAGLGASHQTGWTGLVADLIVRLSRAREGSGS
jgi:hypothetical protein